MEFKDRYEKLSVWVQIFNVKDVQMQNEDFRASLFREACDSFQIRVSGLKI